MTSAGVETEITKEAYRSRADDSHAAVGSAAIVPNEAGHTIPLRENGHRDTVDKLFVWKSTYPPIERLA